MSPETTHTPGRAAPTSMPERVAAFDWATTALGPASAWPESLATSVRTVLERPFPEALLWGPELVFCAYNDAYRAFLAGRPEALGRRFADVWPELRDAMAPLLDGARQGRATRFEEASVALCRDGVVERRHFDFSFSPVRAADGTVMAVLVFGLEATDRVRARAGLEEGMERLRLAAEATGFASYDFDVETRTSDWSNPIYSLVQFETGGPVSQDRIFEQIHPDDRETFEGFVRETLGAAGPGRHAAEFRIVRGDGDVRWVRDSNQVLFEERDGGRRPARVVGTLQDITERRRAEEALRESDLAKDEFLAILGHELRNPLAPIRTALDTLRQRPADVELSARLVPMMDRQVSHMTRLVDDLLSLSRINRGDVEVQRVPLRLDEVVETAVEQTRSLAEDRGHALTVATTAATSAVSSATGGLRVRGDFERLTQVVANLLRNAVKYMEPGGRVDVRTAAEGGEALVRVRDAGYGIPPERLEHVFAMFHQVPEHRRLSDGGLGIGLALSRRLVELHDGSIEAFSDGLGRGSEFVVRLPIDAGTDAPVDPRAAPERDADEAAAGPRRRVLVVDDNVDAAEGLARLLGLKGHVAATAHSGRAALEALDGFDAEIVLLDLGLPGMDGFEVARRMRSMPGGAALRIVALTGWGQEQDKARTRRAGFDDHLTKPIRAGEILALLAGDG